MVHGILLARVPRSEVDDLVQDIFLHAFQEVGHTSRLCCIRTVDSDDRAKPSHGLSPARKGHS
jgi:hypothetical protein